MLKEILLIAGFTLFPLIELRGSIPYGILILKLPPWIVITTAVVANILIGLLAYYLLDILVRVSQKFPPIHRFYKRTVERTHRKIAPLANKYGWLGIAVFIGIPLPMTGVLSGAIAAEIIGMDFKRFAIAVILGVLMAAAIVSAITLTGSGLASLFIHHIS